MGGGQFTWGGGVTCTLRTITSTARWANCFWECGKSLDLAQQLVVCVKRKHFGFQIYWERMILCVDSACQHKFILWCGRTSSAEYQQLKDDWLSPQILFAKKIFLFGSKNLYTDKELFRRVLKIFFKIQSKSYACAWRKPYNLFWMALEVMPNSWQMIFLKRFCSVWIEDISHEVRNWIRRNGNWLVIPRSNGMPCS